MEILIFSDSHGCILPMRRAMALHPHARYALFCGDGLGDFFRIAEEYPRVICCAVRGNCDRFDPLTDAPEMRTLTIEGIHIYMMHGHTVGVKSGLGGAIIRAQKAKADVLLFGHTHLPYEEGLWDAEGTTYLFNPGSIGRRDMGFYSYGVMEIRDGRFLLSHGKING